MNRVLITGAQGALGQALQVALAQPSCSNVLALGRSDLDVTDSAQLAQSIKQFDPDLIIHLAASFSSDFARAYQVNVAASKALLDEVLASGKRTRVLLIGSAAEYGHVQAADNPIKETRVLQPVSTYGVTKSWQTQLVGLYASHGVDVVLARIFNLIGPTMSERLFIGRLQAQIQRLLNGDQKRIQLGDLSAVRDYLSTQQAAQQLLAIAQYGEAGEVYHVASGEPVSMRTILQRCLAEYGLTESIVDSDESLRSHTGGSVNAIYADISKITQIMTLEKPVD